MVCGFWNGGDETDKGGGVLTERRKGGEGCSYERLIVVEIKSESEKLDLDLRLHDHFTPKVY